MFSVATIAHEPQDSKENDELDDGSTDSDQYLSSNSSDAESSDEESDNGCKQV